MRRLCHQDERQDQSIIKIHLYLYIAIHAGYYYSLSISDRIERATAYAKKPSQDRRCSRSFLHRATSHSSGDTVLRSRISTSRLVSTQRILQVSRIPPENGQKLARNCVDGSLNDGRRLRATHTVVDRLAGQVLLVDRGLAIGDDTVVRRLSNAGIREFVLQTYNESLISSERGHVPSEGRVATECL